MAPLVIPHSPQTQIRLTFCQLRPAFSRPAKSHFADLALESSFPRRSTWAFGAKGQTSSEEVAFLGRLKLKALCPISQAFGKRSSDRCAQCAKSHLNSRVCLLCLLTLRRLIIELIQHPMTSDSTQKALDPRLLRNFRHLQVPPTNESQEAHGLLRGESASPRPCQQGLFKKMSSKLQVQGATCHHTESYLTFGSSPFFLWSHFLKKKLTKPG